MAKKAIEESDKSKPRFVALDLGPIGEMLEPIGTLSFDSCLLYTSPSPRDRTRSRMPSSA